MLDNGSANYRGFIDYFDGFAELITMPGRPALLERKEKVRARCACGWSGEFDDRRQAHEALGNHQGEHR